VGLAVRMPFLHAIGFVLNHNKLHGSILPQVPQHTRPIPLRRLPVNMMQHHMCWLW
jgi:hypothetical protein